MNKHSLSMKTLEYKDDAKIVELLRASFKGGGEGRSAPLDILLPPLSYHTMCLHTQTYAPSPSHSHKTLFFPLLSHFLDEGLLLT